MIKEDKTDHNSFIKSRTHEISNHSMHTSWGPQPNVKDK